MEALRWILLGIGLVILGGIYYFGTRKTGQARVLDEPAGDPPPPLDEAMERELERLGQVIAEERSGASVAESRSAAGSPAPETRLPDEPEKISSLLLRCRGRARLSGKEIADAAEKVGLTFGDRDIYHRMMDQGDESVVVFSMANLMNPGTFDREQPSLQLTPGLCLFMVLPNPLGALDSWDAMHAAGQRLSSLLDVDLMDENASSLSRQRIAHIRDEMRAWDRRAESPVSGDR